MGKKILVICPFPQQVAAGQRLKYEQYFNHWRSLGYEITVSSYMDMAMWDVVYSKGHYLGKIRGVIFGFFRRAFDLFRIPNYDLVYIFMWVTPFGTNIFERAVRFLAKKLIYDIEDNVMLGQKLAEQHNPNPLINFLKGANKAKYLIRTADHVITSSPFLNDDSLKINQNGACTYISASINTDRFLPVNSYNNDKPLVIGWTGTFSSVIYLDLLRGVFQRLSQSHKFKLKVIGNFDYELEGVDLEVVQWTKEREVEDLQSIDIGVYPLPLENWVFGKSGLKAIQYMAFALPIVASPIGNTLNIIRDRENGLLAKSDEDWIRALAELIEKPALRKRLGEAARKDCVAKYSIHAIANQYKGILESLL